MKFDFNYEVTLDLLKVFGEINDFSSKVSACLKSKEYLDLNCITIRIHCISPKYFPNAEQFETGYILSKKFIASKKSLEYAVRINYEDLQSGVTLKSLVIQALAKSAEEMDSLEFLDFKINTIIKDVIDCLKSDLEYEITPVDKLPVSNISDRKEIPANVLMSANDFWALINSTLEELNVNNKIDQLVNMLAEKTVNEQFGFELRLRKLLQESYHYNVLALAKILFNSVSDDSFLYFRCRLILLGKELFDKSILNPNTIDLVINSKFEGEELLNVSDRAFFKKESKNSQFQCPRDYANDFINYDLNDWELLGEDWEDEDLEYKFPDLWKLYQN